jgi:hypothetical protein
MSEYCRISSWFRTFFPIFFSVKSFHFQPDETSTPSGRSKNEIGHFFLEEDLLYKGPQALREGLGKAPQDG